MPYDASGGTVSSSGSIGSTDPDSGALLATLASAPEGPAVTTVASGIITDTDLSPSPSPPAAMVESFAGYRAPGDPDMGANGVTSASGLA